MQDMRVKDLVKELPGVHMAVIPEEEEGQPVWNVYLINNKELPLTTVLLTSRGYGKVKDEEVSTSTLRRVLKDTSAKSVQKVEFIPEDLHGLTNEFWLSFFYDGEMYDKKYIFLPESLIDENFTSVPIIGKAGVLIE